MCPSKSKAGNSLGRISWTRERETERQKTFEEKTLRTLKPSKNFPIPHLPKKGDITTLKTEGKWMTQVALIFPNLLESIK